jgi:hypothetical protein
MPQLKVEAINASRTGSFRSLLWAVRASRWELTCGFCRTRFKHTGWVFRSSAVCPACGTCNILPTAGLSPRDIYRR